LFRTIILLVALVLAVGLIRYARPPPSALTLLGDSILHQMAPIQSSLPPPLSGATNLGVNGSVVAQIAGRISLIPSTATHVLIEGGVNDLISGSASDIVPGYAAILQSIPRSKHVIVAGVLPVDEAALSAAYRQLVDNAKIAAINTQIVTLCASFPNCVPARSLMSMNMSGKTLDGIHLKDATYREWPALLSPMLVDWRRLK
jgi:lysophospholipase L1-like esterase